jgi:peptidoglycan/xylan/chitin deacetylase (PgdA/CDA1 family)/SAM-dependent methyltransferase
MEAGMTVGDGDGALAVRPTILMYHRVGPSEGGDPWEMTVSPENFESHVEEIASKRTPFPISEFISRHMVGTLPDDAVAITFDDAYHDNLAVAKPILDRYKAPATIFVAPGLLDTPVFWWDRLQQVIWQSAHIPSSLTVPMNGRQVEFDFRADDRRAHALSTLWTAMRDLAHESRDDVLAHLESLLGSPASRWDFRPMTSAELKELASGNIEIGAHTVNHAWLPALDAATKQREIFGSLALCTQLVGYKPRCFSYPYGAFDEETRKIVESAGFLGACTVVDAHVSRGCDRLTLPRVRARNERTLFRGPALKHTRSDPPPPPVGKASLGDLRRASAISNCWGTDRGKPVDRPYIEEFVQRHSGDIKGRVLEVKDPVYSNLFGGPGVERVDVVDIDRSNPGANIYADLQHAPQIPSATYDCVVLTQVLPVVFDLHGLVDTVYRILKPGGVVLITAPGPFSPPFAGDDYEKFYWAFYPLTLRTLLERRFPREDVHVEAHGNLATCAAFIAGLSQQDLTNADYAVDHEHYPLIVAARATKIR